MREILNDTEATATIFVKNRYGKLIDIINIEKGETKYIPIFNGRYSIKLNNEKPLFIYEGSGALPISKANVRYDFSNIKLSALDYFLQNESYNSSISHTQRRLIQSFCELYEQNNNESYTIEPPHYERLLEILLYGIEAREMIIY